MFVKAKRGLESTALSQYSCLEDEDKVRAEENFMIQIDFVHPFNHYIVRRSLFRDGITIVVSILVLLSIPVQFLAKILKPLLICLFVKRNFRRYFDPETLKRSVREEKTMYRRPNRQDSCHDDCNGRGNVPCFDKLCKNRKDYTKSKE
jgi:hypothetical protein